MDRNIRVGIVGAGYVSGYHIKALRSLPYVEIVGLADINRAQADKTAQKWGIQSVYNTVTEMREQHPDVIHVLTPPASHRVIAEQALAMGADVFVEKPLAETSTDCEAMILAANRAGRIISVNHSARFDPAVLRARQMVASGQIGDVVHVTFLRSSDYPGYAGGPLPDPYKTGSYPFLDMGVHAMYLLEQFVGELRTVTPKYSSSGRDLWLTFDEWRCDVDGSKGTGHVMLSWNSRPIQNELVIYGSRGVVRVDCFLQVCTLTRATGAPKAIQWVANGLGTSLSTAGQIVRSVGKIVTGKLSGSPGIGAGVIAFHSALRDRKPPPVAPEEGSRAVRWIEASCRSADAELRLRRSARVAPVQPADILVTGASGLIGRALLSQLLSAGDGTIRLLIRRPDPEFSRNPRLQCVYGDLGDEALVAHAVSGTSVVYHVGATMQGSREDFERGIVWGTRHIINSCLVSGVKRLVYVSSIGILDNASRSNRDVINEEYRLDPHPDRRGAYTQAKQVAEQEVLAAIGDRQLPAIIIRPGQVFGPMARTSPPPGVIGLGNIWVVAGSGGRRLPAVFVDDVANAIVLAARHNLGGKRLFNVVDKSPLTQREYIKRARRHWKVHVVYIPEVVLFGAALLIEGLGKILRREVPITRYRVKSLRPLDGFDTSAAEYELTWRPLIGTREGLSKTFPPERSQHRWQSPPEEVPTVRD